MNTVSLWKKWRRRLVLVFRLLKANQNAFVLFSHIIFSSCEFTFVIVKFSKRKKTKWNHLKATILFYFFLMNFYDAGGVLYKRFWIMKNLNSIFLNLFSRFQFKSPIVWFVSIRYTNKIQSVWDKIENCYEYWFFISLNFIIMESVSVIAIKSEVEKSDWRSNIFEILACV